MQQGCLPESQRRAIITPRLKKPNADPVDVKNYRPISHLAFMSKVVERLVCHKLVAYLNKHLFFPTLQSAYRRFHSTATSVLKVFHDALLAADRGEVTLLGFFDLSAAFDTVDHEILLDRLRKSLGLHGPVLDWIHSFVSNRTQSVSSAGAKSIWSSILSSMRSVRRTLTTDSAKALVHALIASRLDYCNSILYQKHHCHKDTAVSFALCCATYNAEAEIWAHNTDTSRWSSLVASSRENSFQARQDHLQVSPSNRTAVPSGAVHSSYSEHQSPPPVLCRSWGLTSACWSYVQLRTTQLCCLRSKTVE